MRASTRAARRRAHCRDDGFATVVALSFVMVLATMTTAVLGIGAVAVERHRAESAADLAALAAADHVLEGSAQACEAARRTARAQGAGLARCQVAGLDAVVEVTLPLPGLLHAFGPLRERARAGAR